MQKLTEDPTVEEIYNFEKLFDLEVTHPLQPEAQTPVNEHDTFFQALNDGIQIYWAIKKLLHKNKNQIIRFYANQSHAENICELEDVFLNGLILQEFTYDEKKPQTN